MRTFGLTLLNIVLDHLPTYQIFALADAIERGVTWLKRFPH